MTSKALWSVLVALVALLSMGGLLFWRIRTASEITVQGELRVGSLSCPSPCRIEMTLSDGTRITSRECALPDALRDRAGVHVVAAGTWTEPGTLAAAHLFVTALPAGADGVPNGCKPR